MPDGVLVAGHRVIYSVDDRTRLVTVVAAGHRREIYRSFDL
jgi:mRNA-degrading endonuclease RelE of RelBE toxin-antitoxin system